MFKRITVVALAVGSLVGCAATHTQEHIDYYANIWYSSRYCSEMVNYIDQDTAVKGIAWAKSGIYVDESSRFQSKLQEWVTARRTVSKSECDRTALNIRVHEQEEISNSRKAVTQPTYALPVSTTTTNCYTVEGWTRCTTN